MPEHILVLTSTFPSSPASASATFVRDQVVALKQAYPGMHFSVLAPHDPSSRLVRRDPPPPPGAPYDEFRFHYFWPFALENLTGDGAGIMPTLRRHPLNYLLVPVFVLAEFWALWTLARRLRPDFIYAHWFTPQAIVAAVVSRLTSTPFAFTSHASDVSILRKIPVLGGAIVRSVSRNARAITVVSRRVLLRLRLFFGGDEWGTIAGKVGVVPMGVALPSPDALSGALHPTPRNVLFIGRLVEKKGVQYLLPAFAKAAAGLPDVKLTIAGSGPWLRDLKAQAQSLNLPGGRIQFSGYVSGTQKTSLVGQADLLVVPSIIARDGDTEGLPVALLEGLAAGKICIATNESGADDILQHGIDGFLVPQKNVEALAQTLRQALQMTPDARSRMQGMARASAGKYAWPKIARLHYETLFGGPHYQDSDSE